MKAKWCAWLIGAVLLAACKTAPPCPPGAKLMGEAPPEGQETWCEKIVDGKPIKEGRFTLYWPNGQKMMEGMYHYGKQTGQWTTWYDNSQKSAVDEFRDGLQQGIHVGWYANGQKSAEGGFVNGRRQGRWKRWDPSGFRNWEELYKDGKKTS